MKPKTLFFALAIASFAFAFTACNEPVTKDGTPTAETTGTAAASNTAEQNKKLANELLDAINNSQLDKLASFYADNYIYHPDSTVKGAEGSANYTKGFVAAFDPKFTLLHLVAEGDKVTYHLQVKGKNVGEYKGMAPTNKEFDIETIGIFRYENGKIAEEWEIVQSSKLEKQLAPAPAKQ